jgi:hypothetical protein
MISSFPLAGNRVGPEAVLDRAVAKPKDGELIKDIIQWIKGYQETIKLRILIRSIE